MKKNVIFSHHALTERADRIAYIATTIGFGEIVHSVWDVDNQNYRCITDTGVMMIKSRDDVIITMFIATYGQVERLYNGNVPKSISEIIRRNTKRKLNEKQNGGWQKLIYVLYYRYKKKERDW